KLNAPSEPIESEESAKWGNREPSTPGKSSRVDDNLERVSNIGTDATNESPDTAASLAAADLVPMMDMDAAEVLKLNKRWSGDLSQLGERRFIRALVAYNRVTYFVDHAQQRGVAYAALVEFERLLRAHSGKGHLSPKIVIIPTSRDQLLPALAAGY